jgi:hypothetical protein
MGDESRADAARNVIDREVVTELARTHRRVFVEWSDRNDVHCMAMGHVVFLDARTVGVETGGRMTLVPLARVLVLEPVGKPRDEKADGS